MTARTEGSPTQDSASPLPANMLHAFLDSAVDIIACHGRDHRFIYVNRAIEKVTGIPPSACIGHTAVEAGIPEHGARAFNEALDEVFARGAKADFELEFPAPDGARFIHMRLTPEIGPDGVVRNVVSVSRDVTERNRMEQALAESEARYRSVVEDQTEVVSRLRPDGTLTFVNDVYCRFFGRSKDELLGTKWNPIAHAEDIPRVEAELRRLSPENQVVVIENRVVDAEGRIRWMEFVNRGLFDGRGALVEVQSVGRDIEARKKMEAERQAIDRKLQETQKLESLGVLAGGIAHDFNNLLTGILGNASLARLVLPNHSPALEALDEIEKASLRAADLCRQMLAYAGKGRLMTEPIELSKLVEDSAPLLKVFISKKAVLHFELSTSLPVIIGDATQIRQILMNIVINASDAIGDRSGRIIVSTGVVRTNRAYLRDFHAGADLVEGDYVSLEVTDNGCGMSKETLTRIFEPFFTTKFTGRGLGLSAVLGIVQSHNAGIKIYSEVGKGTSFKLIFPCAQEPAERAAPSSGEIEPYQGDGLVLVVDDEETVRAVTARILEAAGFRVALAGDGREGVERFRSDTSIRVVLLDLTMPRLSGEDAFRELRTIRESTPVILMSGYSPEELKIQFAGKGLAGYLRKPFRPSELLSAVKQALERERRRPVAPG